MLFEETNRKLTKKEDFSFINIEVNFYVGLTANRTPRRKEIERKQSLDIERWLKNKFREGCHKMQENFEAKDTSKNGVVSVCT